MENWFSPSKAEKTMEVKGLKTILLVLSLWVLMSSNMKTCWATKTSNTSFIQSCCASTMYRKLCYSSLSPYASSVRTNRTKLAVVALKVSLSGTRNTSTLLGKVLKRPDLMKDERANIKDCFSEVKDAKDELKQSLEEMKYLGGSDSEFTLNSIQAWVSAALTDDETCLDGLDGLNGQVVKTIRKSVTLAERLTSNALAIISGLTSN